MNSCKLLMTHLQAALVVLVAAPGVDLALIRQGQAVPPAESSLRCSVKQGIGSFEVGCLLNAAWPASSHSLQGGAGFASCVCTGICNHASAHLHDAHALEPADAPRLALQRAVAVAQRASVVPAPGPNLALCIDGERVAAAGDERRAGEAAPGLRTGCVAVCEQLPP